MLQKHVTREGKTMLIAQMDDKHLHNYLKLMLGKVNGVQSIRQGEEITDYHRKLYDLPKVDDESVADMVREALTRLYPYIAEAFLRGGDQFNDIRDLLQQILGRSEAVPKFQGVPQLQSVNGFEDVPEELEEDEDW